MSEVGSEPLLRVLDDEGRALLALADGADLARPVADCPGWTVADLVAHLTAVYGWAALIVAEQRQERPARQRAAPDEPDRDGPALLAALADTHTRLVETLRKAPAELDCWTMWPAPSSRDYWVRRQAHETLVHRVDVRNAVLAEPLDCADVAAEIAADGVDEMVMGFIRRFRDRLRSPVPGTVCLHATDVDRQWWIRLGAEEPEFGRGPTDDANRTEVHARAGELLLALWNRRSWQGLNVTGNDEPLSAWRQTTRQ